MWYNGIMRNRIAKEFNKKCVVSLKPLPHKALSKGGGG